MKQLTCNRCKKQWIIDENDIQYQKHCPFCEQLTYKEIDMGNTSLLSFQDAIALAMDALGEDVLLNPTRLSGYIMDIEPRFSKEIRIFKRAIGNEYSRFVKLLCEKNTDDFDFHLVRYKQILIDNEGLSNEWGETICNTLRYVLLTKKASSRYKLDGVKVEEVNDESDSKNSGCNKERTQKQHLDSELIDAICELPIWVRKDLDLISVWKFIKEEITEEEQENIVQYTLSKDYCSALNILGNAFFKKEYYRDAWQLFSKTANQDNDEGKRNLKRFYKKGLLGLVSNSPLYK